MWTSGAIVLLFIYVHYDFSCLAVKTTWTRWSSCSVTCGSGVRVRSQICAGLYPCGIVEEYSVQKCTSTVMCNGTQKTLNKDLKNGGQLKAAVSPEAIMRQLLSNKSQNVNSKWAPWSSWSNCTRCASFKTWRYRVCIDNTSAPLYTSCRGKRIEFRNCSHSDECRRKKQTVSFGDELKITFPKSRLNITNQRYIEISHRMENDLQTAALGTILDSRAPTKSMKYDGTTGFSVEDAPNPEENYTELNTGKKVSSPVKEVKCTGISCDMTGLQNDVIKLLLKQKQQTQRFRNKRELTRYESAHQISQYNNKRGRPSAALPDFGVKGGTVFIKNQHLNSHLTGERVSTDELVRQSYKLNHQRRKEALNNQLRKNFNTELARNKYLGFAFAKAEIHDSRESPSSLTVGILKVLGSRRKRDDGCVGSCWSDWSPWTDCSTQCGEGHKIRSRTCKENGERKKRTYDKQCPGGNHESKSCESKKDCIEPEDVELSDETIEHIVALMKDPAIGDKWEEKKYNDSLIKTGLFCYLTVWSGWSECSTTCNEGVKYRLKACRTMEGKKCVDTACFGDTKESLICNKDPKMKCAHSGMKFRRSAFAYLHASSSACHAFLPLLFTSVALGLSLTVLCQQHTRSTSKGNLQIYN